MLAQILFINFEVESFRIVSKSILRRKKRGLKIEIIAPSIHPSTIQRNSVSNPYLEIGAPFLRRDCFQLFEWGQNWFLISLFLHLERGRKKKELADPQKSEAREKDPFWHAGEKILSAPIPKVSETMSDRGDGKGGEYKKSWRAEQDFLDS